MSRVYETLTVLCLLGMLVLGMTYVMSSLIDHQKSNLHTLLSKYFLPIVNEKLILNLIAVFQTLILLITLIYRFVELLLTIFVFLCLFRRSGYVTA